MGDLLIKKSAI